MKFDTFCEEKCSISGQQKAIELSSLSRSLRLIRLERCSSIDRLALIHLKKANLLVPVNLITDQGKGKNGQL